MKGKKLVIVGLVLGLVFLTGCNGIDNTPPMSTKIANAGSLGTGVDWISSTTEFSFTATDDYSGVNATYYRTWYNGSWINWTIYTIPFNLNGTGEHYIEYYSVDNAGNSETVHNQTHYLDDSPPETTKNIGSVLYCSKLYFDGNESLNYTKVVISPIYELEVHCKNLTTEEMQFVFYDVGLLEQSL